MALVRLHSVRDFFRIMFSWKRQSIGVFAAIVGLIMAFAYIYTPDYEATAKILILPQSSEGVVVSAGESKSTIFPVSNQDINTEMELLLSNQVMRETVLSFAKEGKKGLGLRVERVSWIDRTVEKLKYYLNELLIALKLKERLSPFDANVALLANAVAVEPIPMSNVFLVTLKAEMPRTAAIVLNRLLEIYVAHHNSSFTKEEGVKFLSKEAGDYYSKLENVENKVKDYQKTWNIVDIKRQIETNIALLAEFTQDVKRNEVAIESLRNKISILKEDMDKKKRDFVITKEMRSIPAVVELERSIVPLLVKRTELLKTFNPSSREIGDLDGQIDALRGEIRKEILAAVKTDEMELETLKVQKRSLQAQIARLQDENEALNQREQKLANMEREAEMLEKNYILYAGKAEDARITKEQRKEDLASVVIADKATIPVKPSFPNRMLMLLVSIFVGFFAALGTPFLLEFLDHRIKTSGEVEKILSLPVISYFTVEKS